MTTYLANDWVVEPCNVAIINCITSVNIANIPGHNCSNTDRDLVVDSVDLKGDIKLEAGFNCTIEERNNTFTIGSLAGGGACLTEKYCSGNLLEVDNECTLCNETVKAINGVNGKAISIKSGPGVTITAEDENTLLIKLETQQFKNGCEIENETESESTDQTSPT